MTRLFAGTVWDRPPVCDRCQQPESTCKCPPVLVPPEKQQLKVFSEKRQKGKMVTVIKGVLNQADAQQQLLTTLKGHCGAGGTIKDDQLEIQGDHVEKIKTKLKELGYKLK